MIHYNRHDNRGYKWCTPAKVHRWTWSLFHWQFLECSAISKPLPFAWISQLLYLQIACIQPEYQIRKKSCGYGPVPCPGDIFVFMFTEIPLCESVLSSFALLSYQSKHLKSYCRIKIFIPNISTLFRSFAAPIKRFEKLTSREKSAIFLEDCTEHRVSLTGTIFIIFYLQN